MSLRAQSRRNKPAARAIFRPVLSSPFALDWPSDTFSDTAACRQWLQSLPKPDNARRTVGINECSRAIEKIIAQLAVKAAEPESAAPPNESETTTVLLVCRHDVDPQALLGHVPMLVAVLNALQAQTGLPTWPLCVLPKGAEAHLAECLSLKQCSIAAVQCPRELIPTSAEPTPSWLTAGMKTHSGIGFPSTKHAVKSIEPRVKMIRSTAPLDLNGVKNRKKQVRQERRRQAESARKAQSSPGKREAPKQKVKQGKKG